MPNFTDVHREEKVTWNGQEYAVRRPTFQTEGLFSKFLLDRAAEFPSRCYHIIGEKGFKDAMAAISSDYAAGGYDWGSETVEKALRNEKPLKELLFLILTQAEAGRVIVSRDEFAPLWDARKSELVEAFWKAMAPNPTAGEGVPRPEARP